MNLIQFTVQISYRDGCRQPQGWISWSLTQAVWLASWGNDAQTPQGLSHRTHSLSDKVWRGADFTCQWKESWSGGIGGLMENTENRNERNPFPLLLLARSDSPPHIFYSLPLSTTLPPARVLWRKLSHLSFFCGGFCHFIDLEDDFFFLLFFMWSMKISKRLVVITCWCMRTLCVWFTRLSGIKQQCFFSYVLEDIAAPVFPSFLRMESLNVLSFSPSVVHFDFEEKLSVSHNGFFYFPLLPAALYHPTHFYSSSSCSLLPGIIVPLDKRSSDACGPGKGGDHL